MGKCEVHDECFKRIEDKLEQQTEDIRRICRSIENFAKEITALRVRFAYWAGSIAIVAFLIPLLLRFWK